jgi:hypothetical protein
MSAEPMELVTLRAAGTVETLPVEDGVTTAGGERVRREREVYFANRDSSRRP